MLNHKKYIKSFKITSSAKKILNILENEQKIFFFIFNYLNEDDKLNFKKFLIKNNLTSKIINKSQLKYLMNKLIFKKFFNLLDGNILIVYGDINLNNQELKILLENKKLNLIGLKLDKQIYRTSQLKKLLNNSTDVNIRLIKLLKLSIFKTNSILSLLNYK